MGAQHRILVVEDDPDIAESLRMLLGLLPGCSVHAAATFQEGLAEARRGGWDVVVCDEGLPGGRGTDILAEMARTQPGTARVLTTGFPNFELAVRAVNHGGVQHFARKPMDSLALATWIRHRMDEHPALAEAAPG